MSAKITLFRGRVKELDHAAVRALEKTTDALLTEIIQAQVIPYREGHLQNDATFIDVSEASAGRTEIVSSTPYARRLYFHPEYNFHQEPWESVEKGKTVKHSGNPHAKSHWFEDWADGGKNAGFSKKAFEAFYKQEAGL